MLFSDFAYLDRCLHLSGFQSTIRANPLAQKIVSQLIAQGISEGFYAPDQCKNAAKTFPSHRELIFPRGVCQRYLFP
jgi:hypothetical protein